MREKVYKGTPSWPDFGWKWHHQQMKSLPIFLPSSKIFCFFVNHHDHVYLQAGTCKILHDSGASNKQPIGMMASHPVSCSFSFANSSYICSPVQLLHLLL